MSGTPPLPPEERQRASFVALVLLLREIAQGLLADGRVGEARGIIDGLAALRAKTAGNLSPEEDRFLGDVLAGLRSSEGDEPREEPA